ncbi:MAG: hypothetical protein NVSMB64_00600 [Candidatus Velthaea sp.]
MSKPRRPLARVAFVCLLVLLIAWEGDEALAAPGRGPNMTRIDAAASRLDEDWQFSAGLWSEQATYGNWFTRYAGFGTVGIVTAQARGLELSPAVATSSEITHAGLVTSTQSFANILLSANVTTLSQLRTPQPNPWEVGWLIWHFQDDDHFYYLIAKPNGWELGKRSPGEPGGQRFLLAGATPVFPVGAHVLQVLQVGPTMQVAVDGLLLGTFVDRTEPYLSGRIGLYTEDARVRFGTISAEPLP